MLPLPPHGSRNAQRRQEEAGTRNGPDIVLSTFSQVIAWPLYGWPQSDCSRVVTTTLGKSGDGLVSREFIGWPRRFMSRNAAT